MSNKSIQILIVEDNEELATFIKLELEIEGYKVEVASDGQAGLMLFRQLSPDLMILDWEMPRMSGVDVLQRIRQTSMLPILMLTAKGEVQDKVKGLDSGATDYLVKPFDLNELLARIRAMLRQAAPPASRQLIFEKVILDTQTHEAFRANHLLELSPKEFELLHYFMLHPRQVLSKAQIFEKVWGWNSDNYDTAVEVYIHSLRAKLEVDSLPRLIHTKRGVGYLLKEN